MLQDRYEMSQCVQDQATQDLLNRQILKSCNSSQVLIKRGSDIPSMQLPYQHLSQNEIEPPVGQVLKGIQILAAGYMVGKLGIGQILD